MIYESDYYTNSYLILEGVYKEMIPETTEELYAQHEMTPEDGGVVLQALYDEVQGGLAQDAVDAAPISLGPTGPNTDVLSGPTANY